MTFISRLAPIVSPLGSLTNAELLEVENLFNWEAFSDGEQYEYSGNFIISKSSVVRDEAVCNMCCGIHCSEATLSNGETVYIAFDYGH